MIPPAYKSRDPSPNRFPLMMLERLSKSEVVNNTEPNSARAIHIEEVVRNRLCKVCQSTVSELFDKREVSELMRYQDMS